MIYQGNYKDIFRGIKYFETHWKNQKNQQQSKQFLRIFIKKQSTWRNMLRFQNNKNSFYVWYWNLWDYSEIWKVSSYPKAAQKLSQVSWEKNLSDITNVQLLEFCKHQKSSIHLSCKVDDLLSNWLCRQTQNNCNTRKIQQLVNLPLRFSKVPHRSWHGWHMKIFEQWAWHLWQIG